MCIHHYGIYTCRFRLVQGVYESVLLYAGRFSNCFKVFHCKVAFEVFPACITAVSPFGQSRLPWNCPEEHCRDNAINTHLSTHLMCVSPGTFAPDCIMEFSFLVKGLTCFLTFKHCSFSGMLLGISI